MVAATDLAVRVTVAPAEAEVLGAVLMDRLGPFERQEPAGPEGEQPVVLVFYPPAGAVLSRRELLESLPAGLEPSAVLDVEVREVARDWVEGWRDHFWPLVVGAVRIRPPWVPAQPAAAGVLVDVVINPGLGFGTGLHPTTRGTLRLLQRGGPGPLLDVGTGSGVLAVAGAKLGWAPVLAFDNDAAALAAARENVEANGVAGQVRLYEADVDDAPLEWFAGATVLANLTLEPVLRLVGRLAAVDAPGPLRLVVSGILAGEQEAELLETAERAGFRARRRLYEGEWVTVELTPGCGTG